jgi:malonyl-CoA O-methyltransferase
VSDLSPTSAYKKWAATYDSTSNLTRDLDALVTKRVLGKLKFDSVIEFGCGTGKNTRLFAKIGKKVVALDTSPAMIGEAKKKLRSRNVTFAIADISKAWPVADRSTDLVSCNLILEHVRDLNRVFSEASRSLRKRGRFFVCELHPYRQMDGKKATFSVDGKKVTIRAFQHHVSEFLTAARDAGFELSELKEWWHKKDKHEPPHLLSVIFVKR